MAIRRKKHIDGRELDVISVSKNSSFFVGSAPATLIYDFKKNDSKKKGSKETKENTPPSPGIISMVLETVSKKLDLKPTLRIENLAHLIRNGVVNYKKINNILIENIRQRDPPFQMYAEYFKSDRTSLDGGYMRYDYIAGSSNLLLAYLGVYDTNKRTCKYSIMLSPYFNDAKLLRELTLLGGKDSDGNVIGECIHIDEVPIFLNGSIFDPCIKDSNHFNSKEYFGLGQKIDNDISALLTEVSSKVPISTSFEIPSYESLCEYFSEELSDDSKSEKEIRALLSIARVFYRIGISYDDRFGKYTFRQLPYGPLE